MINAIINGTLDDLLSGIEKEAKSIRNVLYDIVLYTEGAYNIKDLYIMPVYYISEILERIREKNEHMKQEMDKVRGVSRQYF